MPTADSFQHPEVQPQPATCGFFAGFYKQAKHLLFSGEYLHHTGFVEDVRCKERKDGIAMQLKTHDQKWHNFEASAMLPYTGCDNEQGLLFYKSRKENGKTEQSVIADFTSTTQTCAGFYQYLRRLSHTNTQRVNVFLTNGEAEKGFENVDVASMKCTGSETVGSQFTFVDDKNFRRSLFFPGNGKHRIGFLGSSFEASMQSINTDSTPFVTEFSCQAS